MNQDLVAKGLAFVRKHFPGATVGELDEGTAAALEAIGSLDNPLPADILVFFDRHKVGIWSGNRVGPKP